MEVKIEESWKRVLSDQFSSEYFSTLVHFVREEYKTQTVYPPGKLIFNSLNRCSFDKVRVVIIGQDPYHNAGQAHGLCFSVPTGIDFPPSLINIFKEIRSDLQTEPVNTGDLTRWAVQGVLLLNSILTVRHKQPGSHRKKGWEKFTDAVINTISSQKQGVVFILWGKYAQDKGAQIDRNSHLVLESVHPSPLSASRGFFGNHHFSMCNNYLIDNGKEPIDWR